MKTEHSDHHCPTCGSKVVIHSSDEGTGYMEPKQEEDRAGYVRVHYPWESQPSQEETSSLREQLKEKEVILNRKFKEWENQCQTIRNFHDVMLKYFGVNEYLDSSVLDEKLQSLTTEIAKLRKQLTPIYVKERKPEKYGRYLVYRKNGKVQFETWNNTGWAYNNNDITHWLPVPQINK